MGICIYGVTLEKLSFESSASPDSILYEPFVTHKSYRKSLKNSEIILFTDAKGISDNFLSMTYSNFHDLKNYLCFKLYNMHLDALFNKIQAEDLPNKIYSCPLYHFLHFSDCEGFIGPSAVKEMAKALEDKNFKTKFLRKANKKDSSDDYDYWIEILYTIITETAQVNGYLKFS